MSVVSSVFVLAFALLFPARSHAELWCATPLWVHEWGVQVFSGSGARSGQRGAPPAALPGFFHRRAPSAAAGAAGAVPGGPVRHMPADSGIRALPILHFYAPGSPRSIPVGVEVGFTEGEASAWYPQVDARVPAAQANSAAAQQGRTALLRARAQRQPAGGQLAPVPADPTRQLRWDRLTLSAAPPGTPAPSAPPWVASLRALPALWVERGAEAERFVFYEAQTRERPALSLARGPSWSPRRRHLLIRNTGRHAAHEVFLIHREGAQRYVLYAPTIPAGASAGFLLEDHPVSARGMGAATRDRLRAALVDSAQPTPPTSYRWGGINSCVMQRDPATPVEQAGGHALYAAEVDALLGVWSPRFFEAAGTTLLYREDVAYLDQVMPLSIYTDMQHFVELRRLGLSLIENASLP